MSNKLIISIVIITIQNFEVIYSNYLEVEARYPKSLLERNNVVNKGVWVRNRQREDAKGNRIEDFIFRANSLDVDNQLQSDINTFGENNVPNSPFITSYVERNKRSTDDEETLRNRKSIKKCNTKNCISKNGVKKSLVQSKLIAKLKPASVFNDYPYEIAILLDNTRKEIERVRNISKMLKIEEFRNTTEGINLSGAKNNFSVNIETLTNNNEDLRDMYNVTNDSDTAFTPKRSMKDDFESKLIKKIDFVEDVNETHQHSVTDRDIFNRGDTVWHQNAPVPETQRLNIIPRTDEQKKSRPVTERGLLKVLSILTKTFKKIMKQHNNIKEIHKKMHNMNKDFVKNTDAINEKFKGFDVKYAYLMKFNEKLQLLEDKFKLKEEYYKTKEAELERNLIEFENQQKKFLTQQRQFYNIQKIMLAQNEKISAKQNLIAKTQSEISHRQNNFARILKKAKQIYIDKHPTTAIKSDFPKLEINKTNESEVTHTTTAAPLSTESVTINLFSIPAVTRLENHNQDHLLLNEKDEQPVDDLVYKYYFNNTFIDNLMKNNILSSFVSTRDNTELKSIKNKRNEGSKMQTTLLLPVDKIGGVMELLTGQNLNRKRRWVNHHSERKSKRHNRGKGNVESNTDDAKKNQVNSLTPPVSLVAPPIVAQISLSKSNPFLTMATNFCNGIGQNINKQVLDWCVEKALRKLQNIDTRISPQPPKIEETKYLVKPQRISGEANTHDAFNRRASTVDGKMVEQSVTTVGTEGPSVSTPAISESTIPVFMTTFSLPSQYTPMSTVSATQNLFFPDNDQLESNLMNYEIKPDLDGNVYYDGSLHASDIMADEGSDGFSDIMQLESNSRIEVDTATFDLQAKRRAYLRKLEDMQKMTKALG